MAIPSSYLTTRAGVLRYPNEAAEYLANNPPNFSNPLMSNEVMATRAGVLRFPNETANFIRDYRPAANSVMIVAPLASASAIEERFEISLSIGLENGVPSETPTHSAGFYIISDEEKDDILSEIDDVLSDCTVLMYDTIDAEMIPAFPWIYPGQTITLTSSTLPYTVASVFVAYRDLTIQSNHPSTSRTFLGINGNFDAIYFDRCEFIGTARAARTTSGRVTLLKIRECTFTETTHRVFDCDPLQVDELYIQDNTLYNINSTVFYFPAVPANTDCFAVIERNDTFCEPEHIAIPNGSYASIALVRTHTVECNDNTSEGYKTLSPVSTGTYDLRCSHILEQRNSMLNCGACWADEEAIDSAVLKSRRILNCKSGSGLNDALNFTGRWEECSWTIEPEYFEEQELPIPKLLLGAMNYRDIEIENCTIAIYELIGIGNDSRFIPSWSMVDCTITASILSGIAVTYCSLFWFSQNEGTEVGNYTFDNVQIDITSATGDGLPTMLLRLGEISESSEIVLDTLVLTITTLDYLFYIHPLSVGSEWTFSDSVFTVSLNEQIWFSGRQPTTINGIINLP